MESGGPACHQLSIRGRGLSESTKGEGGLKKRHNNQERIKGMDGGKEAEEGLESRPIRK